MGLLHTPRLSGGAQAPGQHGSGHVLGILDRWHVNLDRVKLVVLTSSKGLDGTKAEPLRLEGQIGIAHV